VLKYHTLRTFSFLSHVSSLQELRQGGLDTKSLEVSKGQMQEQLNMLKGVAEEGRVSAEWPQPETPLPPMPGNKR